VRRESAEMFTEIPQKNGWNIVFGCCYCQYRRTKENIEKYPTGEIGSCILVHPIWPNKPPLCCRSKCPIKLRLLLDIDHPIPFKVYGWDKPTLWWRFKQWCSSIRRGIS